MRAGQRDDLAERRRLRREDDAVRSGLLGESPDSELLAAAQRADRMNALIFGGGPQVLSCTNATEDEAKLIVAREIDEARACLGRAAKAIGDGDVSGLAGRVSAIHCRLDVLACDLISPGGAA